MTEPINPPMGGVLIMGGHAWGYGATMAAARSNFRTNGGRVREPHKVYVFDTTTEFHGVDNVGRVTYVGAAPQAI